MKSSSMLTPIKSLVKTPCVTRFIYRTGDLRGPRIARSGVRDGMPPRDQWNRLARTVFGLTGNRFGVRRRLHGYRRVHRRNALARL